VADTDPRFKTIFDPGLARYRILRRRRGFSFQSQDELQEDVSWRCLGFLHLTREVSTSRIPGCQVSWNLCTSSVFFGMFLYEESDSGTVETFPSPRSGCPFFFSWMCSLRSLPSRVDHFFVSPVLFLGLLGKLLLEERIQRSPFRAGVTRQVLGLAKDLAFYSTAGGAYTLPLSPPFSPLIGRAMNMKEGPFSDFPFLRGLVFLKTSRRLYGISFS